MTDLEKEESLDTLTEIVFFDDSKKKTLIDTTPCSTPWWQRVESGDSVLAYTVNQNNSDICDVQTRSCIWGVLTGDYAYPSCDVAQVYCPKDEADEQIAYRRPILANSEDIDPFVQPDTWDWWDLGTNRTDPLLFDEHGVVFDPNPLDMLDVVSHEEAFLYPSWDVDNGVVRDCITPWNERVPHGQFVKAYKYPEGYGTQQCEVEIRGCSQWYLQGTYLYESCVYNDHH